MEPGWIAVAGLALAFGLVSARVLRSDLSPTMIFAGGGLAFSTLGWLEVDPELLHHLGEWTLILLLFGDASRIKLSSLRKEISLPIRLLAIGMPLTILLGAGVAMLIFPELSIWEAALLSAILAPTDAALGQAVVSSPVVPQRIRQALNVESGLNDGIALPFIMIFAALAGETGGGDAGKWLGFAALQVGGGVGVGALVGWLGGRVIAKCDAAGMMSPSFERVSAIAVVALAVLSAHAVGGNVFISAFCAGLLLGNSAPEYAECVHEFLEAEGQLLMLVVFMLIGAIVVGPAMSTATLPVVAYALLSLTLLRMLPVWLSMRKSGATTATAVFVGWFGPRGLASVLFALLIVEDSGIEHADFIFQVATCTVVLSIIFHGISANRGAKAYGARMAAESDAMEAMPVEEHRARVPTRHWEN